MKKVFSLSLLIAAMVIGFTSCNKPVVDSTFTVTFDSRGGTPVAAISKVTAGSTINEPTAPTRDGNTFAGWYKEANCITAWDFVNDKVNSDITLYAKWTAISFYAQLLGSYNAHGTPSLAEKTGPPDWTCEIADPQDQNYPEQYYLLKNWAGNSNLFIVIDIVDGKYGIQPQSLGSTANYTIFLCPLYYNQGWAPSSDFYPITWNSTTQKLDMSGKINGFNVCIAVLAIDPTSGSVLGVFGDGYSNLVLTKTTGGASISGKPVITGKANADGIIPIDNIKGGVKNFDASKFVRRH